VRVKDFDSVMSTTTTKQLRMLVDKISDTFANENPVSFSFKGWIYYAVILLPFIGINYVYSLFTISVLATFMVCYPSVPAHINDYLFRREVVDDESTESDSFMDDSAIIIDAVDGDPEGTHFYMDRNSRRISQSGFAKSEEVSSDLAAFMGLDEPKTTKTRAFNAVMKYSDENGLWYHGKIYPNNELIDFLDLDIDTDTVSLSEIREKLEDLHFNVAVEDTADSDRSVDN